MNTSMDSTAQSGAESGRQARTLPRTRPCSRACTHSGMDADTRTGTGAPTKAALRKARCPLGFSEMQIAILSLLKARPPLIAYWQIAESVTAQFGLEATEGMARGALERLFKRGFLVRSRAASGRAQGNRYAFASDPCPHITPPVPMESGMEASMERDACSCKNPAPSFLTEKTDRKNLSVFSGVNDSGTAIVRLESLTEEDVFFHWPNLTKAGFGTCQIRQILARLFQVGIGAENLAQGLTYAEWELEQGTMRDKNGEPVANPLNWVFSSLARTGYYRRPQGYISLQEQAEIDAAKEYERLKKAREIHKKSAFEAWRSGLSPEEKNAIAELGNRAFPMPEDTALRQHFFHKVWPDILKQGSPSTAEKQGRNMTKAQENP